MKMSRQMFHDELVSDLLFLIDSDFQIQYKETSIYLSSNYSEEIRFFDESCTMLEGLGWLYAIIQEQLKYPPGGSLGLD